MKYAMLICADGIPASDEEEALVRSEVMIYIAETGDRDVFGRPLLGPDTATTVRVRDGQTLLTDGPFVETKEHIAGFDLVVCDDREQAIAFAARHPLAWFHKVEVRACAEWDDDWTPAVLERLNTEPAPGAIRYLLLVCVDPTSELEEPHPVDAWVEEHTASGARIVGQVLEAPDRAVTVRVRGPHTLVTDGPFAETKEFVAGFDVIECADLDAAVAIAAGHPMASAHMIEVRPFGDACGLAD